MSSNILKFLHQIFLQYKFYNTRIDKRRCRGATCLQEHLDFYYHYIFNLYVENVLIQANVWKFWALVRLVFDMK